MNRENLKEYLEKNPKIGYKGIGGYNTYVYDHCDDDDDLYFFSYSGDASTSAHVELRLNFVKMLIKLNNTCI